MRLKDYVKERKNKIRSCPKCKSKKGFELRYSVSGNGGFKMDFKGKTIDAERDVFDTLDKYATCLNCGKSIDTDKLQTD